MHLNATRRFRWPLALVALATSLFGLAGSTSAASIACDEINALGTPTGIRQWTSNQFASGETVRVTFSDNGSQINQVSPMSADMVILSNSRGFPNHVTHNAANGPAGSFSETTAAGAVETEGLRLNVRTTTAITQFSISCSGAVVAPTITLSPATVGRATYNAAYSRQMFTASGGTAPYFWSATGALPAGMRLSHMGELSGTPSQVGSFAFTVTVEDAFFVSGTRDYTLIVDAAAPAAPTGISAIAGTAQAQVSFTAGDSGGAPATYTATSIPDGRTATGNASPLTVTGLSNGISYAFTVTADNGAGTATSASSNSVTPAASQTITFNNPGTQTYGTAPTLTATSSSGLPVTFASTSTAVCSISSTGVLSFHQAGTCTIQASQDGSAAYLPASVVPQSFSVQPTAPGAPVIGTATAGDGEASVAFSAPANNGGTAITGYTVTAAPGGRSASGSASPLRITGLDNGIAYTFTVTATQGAGTGGPSAASNSVIPIAAQTITFAPPGNRNFGTTSTLVATASSGLAVTLSSTTPAVCTVSGTALTPVAPGTCSVTASQSGSPAFSPATPVTQAFAIIVPGGAVSIPTSALAHVMSGTPYSATLIASGGAAPYHWTASGLPAGLGLSPTGVISGTTHSAGVFIVVLTVTDAAGQTASANTPLTVDAPTLTITPASLPAARIGDSYTQTLSASGGIAPYQFAAAGGTWPAGLHLDASGQLQGIPTAAGNFTLQISATDAHGFQVVQAYPLNIGQPAPLGTADTASTGANTAVSIAVTTNDTGPITAIAIAQAPTHGTATVAGLSIVYTPGKDYIGQDSLTYVATGPGGSSPPTTVTISVQAGAVPVPAAPAHEETLLAGRRLRINAAEGAGNGPFTAVTIVTAPASGTLEVSGTDLFYTADPQASGEVSFIYTLSNAFGPSAPVRVALHVNPTPVAPAITDTTVAGTSRTVDLTASATGGPFIAANVISVQPASAGTASIIPAASGYALVFVAAERYAGTARVAYTLSNAYTTSPASTVSFVVQGRADPAKDAEVVGLLSAQADATRRMASGQISNFQHRLEQLRSGQPTAGFSNGIRLNATRSTRPAAATGERDPGAAEDSLPEAASTTAAAPHTSLLPGTTSVWTGGAINVGKAGKGHGDTSTDFTTSGLSIGADTRVADGLVIGGGAGYGHDATDVGNAGSRSEVDSYSAAVYASYQPADALFADLLLGYQWLSLDAIRHVTGTDRRVFGSRDGTQWFGALSVGYQLRTDDLQLTPYGRIEWARAGLDGYTEQGDGIHALSYQRQTVVTSTASAGLLAQFTVKREYGVWTPQVRAEYGRDLEGTSEAFMRYADLLDGTVYRTSLQQRSRNRTLLGGGLSLQTRAGWTLSAEYQLQLDSDTRDNQTLRLGVEKRFDH